VFKIVVAVISNKEQFELVSRQGLLKKSGLKIFCDNSAFYEFLAGQEVSFTALDEFLIQDKWLQINSWACSAVNQWIGLCEEKAIFGEVNIVRICRLFLTHYLVQLVKNYFFAYRMFEDLSPSSAIVFTSKAAFTYPVIRGNDYLNYFLKKISFEKEVAITTLNADCRAQSETAKCNLSDVPFWKILMRRSLNQFLAWRTQKVSSYPDCVAYGALKHLAPVMLELKKRHFNVAIYDYAPHKDFVLFCLRHRISYLTPAVFEKGKDNSCSAFCPRAEFEKALEIGRNNGVFNFGELDLNDAVDKFVKPGICDYLNVLVKERDVLSRFIDRLHPKTVIVDEDYALKGGFFSEYMRYRGVPVFCISHATVPFLCDVPRDAQKFYMSKTLVGSQYERHTYGQKGWDVSQIIITGIPRYDRFRKLTAFQPARRRNKNIRLLYPVACYWRHSPMDFGYLGSHYFVFGNTSIPAFQGVLKAIDGLSVDLVVIPHNLEWDTGWRRIVRESGCGVNVHLLSGGADFFQELARSDALIISYLSTSILEAAMCHKPVFMFMDKKYDGYSVNDYIENKYVNFTTSIVELREALSELCDKGSELFWSLHQPLHQNYFLGKQDGDSTNRVVDILIKSRSQHV